AVHGTSPFRTACGTEAPVGRLFALGWTMGCLVRAYSLLQSDMGSRKKRGPAAQRHSRRADLRFAAIGLARACPRPRASGEGQHPGPMRLSYGRVSRAGLLQAAPGNRAWWGQSDPCREPTLVETSRSSGAGGGSGPRVPAEEGAGGRPPLRVASRVTDDSQ